MSVDVFETTLHKTHEWLHELMDILHWRYEQDAYQALRGTLHALRDRLPVDLSAKLSSQLPMLIRGVYYEGWRPAATPVKIRTPEEFIDFVYEHFNHTILSEYPYPERIVRAVFQVIANHVTAGEIYHIKKALPLSLAELWPAIEDNEQQEKKRRTSKRRVVSTKKSR